LRLRDEKVRRLARSVRAALPWLTDADQPTVRGWSQLEVLADQAFAVLRVAGITSNGTEPRRLLTDFRQLKTAQLAYAQALGMSPAARLQIQVAGEDKALDLADDQTGLPIVRQRPPNFKPMARPETEVDPDAPKHPGVTIWDFIDARGLDKDDPTIEQAHRWALEEYRNAMVEYRAAKAAMKAAATAVDTPDVVRS
jgi:hypothetical protein